MSFILLAISQALDLFNIGLFANDKPCDFPAVDEDNQYVYTCNISSIHMLLGGIVTFTGEEFRRIVGVFSNQFILKEEAWSRFTVTYLVKLWINCHPNWANFVILVKFDYIETVHITLVGNFWEILPKCKQMSRK